ncbi:MAG: FHA domain-containing protein, partial [Steroidobacteraceae bacterium]
PGGYLAVYGADFNDRLLGCAADGAMLGSIAPAGSARDGTESLVQALRAQVSAGNGDALWVAVPPRAEHALGESLRQLRAAGFAVQGFVDRATVLAAWLRRPGHCAVLDLTRHGLSISLVLSDGAAAALRRTVVLPGGEAALHAAWLNLAAGTLVQQTRFDPLHDQRHEAQLRQLLPPLAAQAQHTGQGSGVFEAGSRSLPLTLARDQFIAAAGDWLQPVAAALQAISAATDDCVLLLPLSMLDIPGLGDALAAARFAAVFEIAEGLPACAASLMPPVSAAPSGGVQFLTRVPLFAAAADPAVLVPLALRDVEGAVMATHLIYRGRAFAIPADGLVIGRDPGAAPAVRLPEGIAGLSRRHCTLRRDGGRTQIVDHSSFGTFIDGVRVRGRALLVAGSVLRLGEPGIELPLVALAEAAAAD